MFALCARHSRGLRVKLGSLVLLLPIALGARLRLPYFQLSCRVRAPPTYCGSPSTGVVARVVHSPVLHRLPPPIHPSPITRLRYQYPSSICLGCLLVQGRAVKCHLAAERDKGTGPGGPGPSSAPSSTSGGGFGGGGGGGFGGGGRGGAPGMGMGGAPPAFSAYGGGGGASMAPLGGGGGGTPADATQRKLFIRSLPFTCTDEYLRQVFAAYGDVEEAVIVKEKGSNKSRGYGFVTMRFLEGARLALERPPKYINDREIIVTLASAGKEGGAPVGGMGMGGGGGAYVAPGGQYGAPMGMNPYGMMGMAMPGLMGYGMGYGMGGGDASHAAGAYGGMLGAYGGVAPGSHMGGGGGGR